MPAGVGIKEKLYLRFIVVLSVLLQNQRIDGRYAGWTKVRFVEEQIDLVQAERVHSIQLAEINLQKAWAVAQYDGFPAR